MSKDLRMTNKDDFGDILQQIQIDTTDKEIDNMVYGLYGLSNEEIKIIESSNEQ